MCPLPSPEGLGTGIWLSSYSAPRGLDFVSFLDTQAQAQLSPASLPASLPPDAACGITGQRTSLPKATGRGLTEEKLALESENLREPEGWHEAANGITLAPEVLGIPQKCFHLTTGKCPPLPTRPPPVGT